MCEESGGRLGMALMETFCFWGRGRVCRKGEERYGIKNFNETIFFDMQRTKRLLIRLELREVLLLYDTLLPFFFFFFFASPSVMNQQLLRIANYL